MVVWVQIIVEGLEMIVFMGKKPTLTENLSGFNAMSSDAGLE